MGSVDTVSHDREGGEGERTGPGVWQILTDTTSRGESMCVKFRNLRDAQSEGLLIEHKVKDINSWLVSGCIS